MSEKNHGTVRIKEEKKEKMIPMSMLFKKPHTVDMFEFVTTYSNDLSKLINKNEYEFVINN